jgi:hypothetical protein
LTDDLLASNHGLEEIGMHKIRLRRGRRDGGARHKRMSYANVAAMLALLAVAGGTAYAAHHYRANLA